MTNERREGTENMIVGQENNNIVADEHTDTNKRITIYILNSKPREKENPSRWPAIFVSLIMLFGIFAMMPVQAANQVMPIPTAGPAPVNLGTAGDFVILAQSGITTTGVTAITGDIGVSPIASTAITGFGLVMDPSGEFSTTVPPTLVTGKVYAANYANPTPAKMTTAVGDMGTAYTDAAGRLIPDYVNLYSGDVTGQTLTPGLWKWTTGLLISAAGVTISGAPSDVWIFQIAQDLTVANTAIITLDGGAQASNIFWQVAGQAILGTTSQFKGIILCKTQIVMQSGATLEGRALAQTAVTTDANNITVPSPLIASKNWILYNGRNYKTFTSSLTPGWMASDLATDVFTYINTTYLGEFVNRTDVAISMYDSTLGLLTTCYYFDILGMWVDDFVLVEGDTYIVEILNNRLKTSPRDYELPNTAISTPVPVSIYNGRNYQGFPVFSAPAPTMASELAQNIEIALEAMGETITLDNIQITMYDSLFGSFNTAFYMDGVGWLVDFPLDPSAGYIVEILNSDLATSPRTYSA